MIGSWVHWLALGFYRQKSRKWVAGQGLSYRKLLKATTLPQSPQGPSRSISCQSLPGCLTAHPRVLLGAGSQEAKLHSCLALSATRGYWASAARLPMLEQVWHMLSLRTSSSLEVRSSRSPSVRSKAVSGKSPPKLHRGSDKSVAELSDH